MLSLRLSRGIGLLMLNFFVHERLSVFFFIFRLFYYYFGVMKLCYDVMLDIVMLTVHSTVHMFVFLIF